MIGPPMRSLAISVLAASAVAQHFELRERGFVEATPAEFAPAALAAGDFDGDGDQDLASVETIWRNDGEGRFVRVAALPVPFVDLLFAGDFDGDGDADLLALDRLNRLTFLRSDPAGFVVGHVFSFPSISNVSTVVVVDIDGDQDLDVVASSFGVFEPYGGRVLLNNGFGQLAQNTAALPVTSHHHYGLEAGDFDGDGDPDLAFLTTTAGSELHVLRNDGAGSFSGWAQIGVGGAPRTLTAVDADGDGDSDLALASDAGEQLLVSDGAGAFTPVAAFSGATPLPTGPLVAADFDGDSDLDLLAVEDRAVGHGLGVPRLWRNDGAGAFTHSAQPWLAAAFATARPLVLDADGDGDPDLSFVGRPRPGLYWNDGAGSFRSIDRESAAWNETQHGQSARSQLADLDGDGDPDLVRTSFRPGLSPRGWVDCWFNDDTGGFGPRIEVLPPALDTGTVGCVDADGDHDLDLFVTTRAGSGMRGPARMFRNDGNGAFSELTVPASPLAPLGPVVAGDVDGDGDDDLVVGDHQGPLTVLVRHAPFVFVDETAARLGAGAPAARDFLLSDFDLDGDLDIAAILPAGGASYFENDGSGFFTDRSATNMPAGVPGPYAWTTVDVEGDGDRDIVWTGFGAKLLRNDNGVFVEVPGSLPVVNGPVFGVAVADLNHDGLEDLYVYRDNGVQLGMELWQNDGQGSFVSVTPPDVPSGYEGHTLLEDLDRDGDVDAVVARCVLHNVERHLENAVPPRVGYHGEIAIAVAEASPGAVVPVVVAGFLRRLVAPLPYSSWGLAWVDPAGESWVDSMRFLAAPHETIRYQVPNTPGLIGARLWMQGVVLHQVGGAGWRLTNLVDVTLLL